MSIVTITLGNKNFQLSCSEASRPKVESLAEKLDHALEDTKTNNPTASFELALVITALGLIDNKQSKLQETGGEVLEQANQDFQKILASVESELKNIAKKVETC
ncbi:MAG: cell division protein ZapA [Rickettsiaceae bacterium]|nr:cell division protein ZapA [Rickettsiaceae bacterium]